jgi:uncharacterized membrane protein
MNKTIKTIWVLSGILVFLWTAFWFMKVKVLHEYAFVSNVIMFTIGLYLMILYIIVAIAYWINRGLYKRKTKRLRRKWKIRE